MFAPRCYGFTAVLTDFNIPIDCLYEALNKVRDSKPVEHILLTAEGEIRGSQSGTSYIPYRYGE